MSDWMQNLQSLLGGVQNALGNADGNGKNAQFTPEALGNYLTQGNLTKLFTPAVLGGLAGVLLGADKTGKTARQALLMGGSAALGAFAWDRYKKQMQAANPEKAAQAAQSTPTPVNERAKRLIRALVFAAKSDGHIDDGELQAIHQKVKELSLGEDTEQLIKQAIDQPLDPAAMAQGIQNEDEALEVYVVSRSVIDVDQFMESNYLDALAKALNIPDNVKKEIDADVAKAQTQS